MSTRSSIICNFGVHIYHEWADQGFVYVNTDEDVFKLCSLENWYKIVNFIKDSEKDCNGKDIRTGKHSFETGPKPE
jgi:hypothetical protein